jgi:hypothetical protein
VKSIPTTVILTGSPEFSVENRNQTPYEGSDG